MDCQVPVGPPRLLDFSCHVLSKAPATDPGNTTTSCLLQLKVQENETKVSEQPSVSTVTVELTRPTLDTLLDGMGRIRDQLSSVAGRK
ncbi:COMM domain-containing protein 9 [Zootermopsis nevadensis]|uniref:COMM domain-containing protein 9 n=1 Tax=Zootermopsis nevadensis TaxID=136037 RepID=A0A067RLV7_ZOONE|nr:COMM domain-containing protein 9 [Zootermopsis nevadensis]